MKALTTTALISLILLVALSLPSHAANKVVLKTQASEEFVKDRARDPTKKIQTYQFMKGTYHPGNRLDSSMEALSFESLVYDLALQLRKKDFYPEPVLGESDLLIVVHYEHPKTSGLDS